jgi:ubiquinone/menaquinone biosynthesis C-methylase UbiE
MTVDFGKSAEDYSAYRPDFHPELFRRLFAVGIGLPGQRILDVGAGTGLLGRGLTAGGGDVVECDASWELLRQAGGAGRVVARAEEIPFGDGSFEAITAGQCWHWFDRRIAPLEIRRVLKAGGRLAIVYQTYLPLDRNIAAASERMILRYRPSWRHAGGVGINGQALKDLQTAGFSEIESFSFDAEIPYARDAWRGFIRTCSAVGPSLSVGELERFDLEHAEMLGAWPANFTVPHRNFAAFATRG